MGEAHIWYEVYRKPNKYLWVPYNSNPCSISGMKKINQNPTNVRGCRITAIHDFVDAV